MLQMKRKVVESPVGLHGKLMGREMMPLVISCVAHELLGLPAVLQHLSTVPNIRRGFNKKWADAWLIPSN